MDVLLVWATEMEVISPLVTDILPASVNWKLEEVDRISVPEPEMSFTALSAITMLSNVRGGVGNDVHAVTVNDGAVIETCAWVYCKLRLNNDINNNLYCVMISNKPNFFIFILAIYSPKEH